MSNLCPRTLTGDQQLAIQAFFHHLNLTSNQKQYFSSTDPALQTCQK
ncbi:hypothetical protein [Serratia symbiotica]